jgi:large subunit ribosomal protein L23
MKQEHLMRVIRAPHMSEKAAIAKEKNREYVFHVLKSATKLDIKQAVELMFKTLVESVRIVNVKSKPKRFGQIQGRSKAWKKAYVKLQAGQEIEFAGNP